MKALTQNVDLRTNVRLESILNHLIKSNETICVHYVGLTALTVCF